MGMENEIMEFINKTNLEFTDISSEMWREYHFSGGDIVKIDKPLKLHVSSNGHRIFDAAGFSHYVPLGWIHLSWKAKEGQPHFVK
jgi:hypothetical protein